MQLPGKFLLVSLFAFVFAAPLASAQAAGTISGPEALQVLKDLELSPEYGHDSQGDPQIMFQQNGLHCRMNFYDCRKGRCSSLQVEVALDLDNGTTLRVMNEYNKTYRYGRMYLDEEMDPFLQFDFELPDSQVEAYLVSQLETFGNLLEHFTEAVGYY
jgi:hypothetical protein